MIDLDLPVSRAELREKIKEVIEANKLDTGAIRLLLTGGYAADSFTPEQANWLILAHEHKSPEFEGGAKLLLHQYQRELPRVKTLNYCNAIRMRKQIREARAHEALYHNGEDVLESFRSNIFFVFDGPVLATPSDNILLGITRKQILKISQSLMPTEVRRISLGEIRHAKEIFLTGSKKPLVPITQIDAQRIGDGKIGPVTRQLMNEWDGYVEAYLSEE
jgi:D-alanine transaminase/branched-chain amino acid aminotransferase